MNRLLRNDCSRLFRSLFLYIAAIAAVAAGFAAAYTREGYTAVTAYAQGYLFVIPVAMVAVSIFLVQEFEFGIVRNKVVMGFRRSRIAASWFAVALIIEFVLLAVFDLTVYVVQAYRGSSVGKNLTVVEFLINAGVTLLLMTVFALAAAVLTTLIGGYESIVTVLFVYFAVAAVTLVKKAKELGAVGKKLYRLIPVSHLGDSVLMVPEEAVTTVCMGVILSVLLAAIWCLSVCRKNLA